MTWSVEFVLSLTAALQATAMLGLSLHVCHLRRRIERLEEAEEQQMEVNELIAQFQGTLLTKCQSGDIIPPTGKTSASGSI